VCKAKWWVPEDGTNPKEIKQLKTKDIKTLRDMLIQEQNNKCALCGKHTSTFHLEHGHKKLLWPGYIRGALCPTCNRREGRIANDWVKMKPEELVSWLRQAADYLEKNINEPKMILHPKERSKLNKKRKRNGRKT